MPEESMKFAGSIANGLAATLIAGASFAEYPKRPINMAIPYGAGGATDISARTIAEPLGNVAGRPLVMANITGADGATGSVNVQNAMADGYAMLFARTGSHSVNPAIKATLPYTLDDFRFVTVYEINPVACATSASSGIALMEDLVIRIGTDHATFSSSGVGSLLHLAAVRVLKEFHVENPPEQATRIPQKGGDAAATAVPNGTATFLCTNSSALANFVANGQLKPPMVTTAEPVVGFDAPTVADPGKPSLHQLVGWTGIAGPDNLPDDIVKKWGVWMAEATQDQEFLNKMTAHGSVIRLMAPIVANAFIQDQYATFRKLVDELGMRIEG